MDVLARLRHRAAGADPLVKDCVLASTLVLVATWELMGGEHDVVPALQRPFEPGLVPLAALMIVPVAVRRRWPLLGWCVAVAAWMLTELLANRFGLSLSAGAALLVLAYSTGAYGARRAASLVAVAVGALLVVQGPSLRMHLNEIRGVLSVYAPALAPITMWVVGDSVRAGRLRARREHESSLSAAVTRERVRIARDLHDVVAHGVTVMVIQAEVARRLLASRPDRAGEALCNVSASGNEALGELRHLLKLLTVESGRAAAEPDAGLAWLESLLARVRAAGTVVELHRRGMPRALSRGLDVTAYRIIQEALTNVLKHSESAAAEVLLEYAPHCLTVQVADRGRGTRPVDGGPGLGLLGLRERVAAFGGELQAGPRPEGGFRVRARLPVGEDT